MDIFKFGFEFITVRDFSGVVRDIDLCAFHSFVQVSDFIMHPSCLSEWSIQFMICFLIKLCLHYENLAALLKV